MVIMSTKRTFPPDSNHRPGRGCRLGGDLALIGLVESSQSMSVATT